MKQLLNEVSKDYDFVLLDTSPAAGGWCSILAAVADGTILVCASGQVSIDGAKRAKELLENVNANIIGVILNKIPINRKSYSQYYYYAYYEEEDKPKENKKRVKGQMNMLKK